MSFGIPVRNGLAIGLLSSTMLSSRAGMSAALMLNFLTGSLDPRITFSRGSQATLTDSTGKITYAPNNLLTNSESFEASSWTKNNVSVTSNSTTAPDGTTTADLVVPNTTGGVAHNIYASVTVAAAAHVLSIYAKSGGYSAVKVGNLFTGVGASFNLATGAVHSTDAGVTATITAVGNGWYRCAVAFTASAGSTLYGAYVQSPVGTNSFAGDGTSGVYLWGAQLEQVTYQTTPSTYNSTTPKNLLGYTQEFDNAAWTKSNAFVQTNLLLQSQFAASWTSSAVTLTANAATAPNGASTAASLADNATSGPHVAFQTIGTTSSVTYTASVYAKAGTGRYLTVAVVNGLSTGSATATFDLQTGSVTQSGTYGIAATFISASATDVGGGWYRLAVVSSNTTSNITLQVCGASAGTFAPDVFGRNSYSGSGSTWLIWGAQLVQGATAGDYQPTYAAAAAVQYAAPDGSRTADKVVENTASARHGVNQGATVVAGVYTASVYAKKGENDFLALAPGGSGQPNTFTWFNLATGAMGTNNNTSASMTDAGNGWYRCSITFTAIAGTLVPLVETSKANGSNVYTGDGTSGIYVWGAQLSNSASVDPYVYNPGAAPTSAAYYGPRFDYDPVTLAAKGLLIEEQRTNLATYSQDFTNAAWTKQEMTVTGNAAVAPDGTTTASNCVPTTLSSTHQISSGALVASSACVISVYAKNNGYNTIEILDRAAAVNGASFNLTTGAATNIGTGVGSAVSVGNGWYRCSVAVTTTGIRFYIPSSSSTFAGNGTSGIYIWGAQLEAGSFATSYIPTVASQVTRSADVATMVGANFSNWYNQSEGTAAVAFSSFESGNGNILTFSDGTSQNFISNFKQSANTYGLYTVSSGVLQASVAFGSAVALETKNTISMAYKASNNAASLNGAAPVLAPSGVVPVLNRLNIGSDQTLTTTNFINGHIRNITYYNYRMPNALLQRITV